jgi:ABC-2 type transport system ATP-binding protein
VSAPAVEFDRVVKRYATHVAVRELSLSIPAGTVFGLLGPNGAGKTTAIRMLLNIIAPDAGSIRVFGRPSTDGDVTDQIGYLPEDRGLYKKMTVRRVLRFLGQLKGLRAREADRRIDVWLERFSLRTADHDWGKAKVDELSRGMQQKVQFIATVLHHPQLVVLDEPFSGLDPVNAQVLKDTILELRSHGRTVILSTHIIENAERMCDAVCIIVNGTKILDGSIAEVKTRYGGPPVERIITVQPSLHEIFLQQVGAVGVEPGMSGQG